MPDITLFAIPKAFEGHVGVIQQNATASWTRLQPKPEIILFGSDPGTAEIARTLHVDHVPSVRCNELGTPLVSDVFQQARSHAASDILVYVNADLILMNDFVKAIATTRQKFPETFLMIGRRYDNDITTLLDFDSAEWPDRLRQQNASSGRLAARVCKDYFAFPKPLFAELPDFAVGRANWDNWMVYHAHANHIPVVDATRTTTVVHQNHDYAHLASGRAEAYVKGIEAKTNKNLAGGMHLVRGSAANWVLTDQGIRRSRLPGTLLSFLADLPRFAKLLSNLVLPRT